MISADTIAQVKERTDLVALIGEYVRLTKAGRSYKGLCPFHKEKSPSFHVSPDRGFFHCFGCQEHGTSIDFVMKVHGLDFREAVVMLAERAGIVVEELEGGADAQRQRGQRQEKDELFSILHVAATYFEEQLGIGGRGHPLASLARAEIDRRGLVFEGDSEDARRTRTTLAGFRVGYAPYGWDGLGAFLVEKGASGLSVGPRATTLGLDAASFASVTLDRVRVPGSARLLGGADFGAALLRFFTKEGLKVAARCVGLCQTAVAVTTDYVTDRKAFGKPIGHFQAIAFTIADRAMDVDAARALVWRAASLWDQVAAGTAKEREALLASGHAISFAQEAAMRCGDDAVQLHGGAGFVRDYPVEKMMRDAKQMQLCVLTAEHADQIAAACELGAPFDLGLVLPTPEGVGTFV